ncbi:MAG: arsenate reductase (glutaredoxin) [Proteobacteria bacterium]|nr:arsenate reductase (glutaredoxin) [Pseudomonadota bacterium]
MRTTIYHNPRCSKSRATLQILTDKGIEPIIIPYLEAPLQVDDLEGVLKILGLEPIAIIRFKESIAKDLGITPKDSRTEKEWLEILVQNPKLLERPIVISGDQGVIGRPPENVLNII